MILLKILGVAAGVLVLEILAFWRIGTVKKWRDENRRGR